MLQFKLDFLKAFAIKLYKFKLIKSMRTGIFTIVFLLVLTLNSFAQDTIFVSISGKTWRQADGWLGTSVVFYKTGNGLLKAIRQINGSGVPATDSEIYDVEIKNDTIFLLNGLNLYTSEKVGSYTYNFDSLKGQIKQFIGATDGSILFNWDNRKSFTMQIDVKLLSEIPIGKNEIYRDTDLIKTFIDE